MKCYITPNVKNIFEQSVSFEKAMGVFKLVHMKKSSLWQEILVVKVFAVLATPQNWLWSRIRCFWQGLLFGSTHLHDKIYVKTFHKMKKKTQCNFPTFIFVSKIYELGRIAHDNSLPFCAKKAFFTFCVIDGSRHAPNKSTFGFFCRYVIGQYVTIHDDVISHINITSVTALDGGVYSCIAANSVGSVAHFARLNVYGRLP